MPPNASCLRLPLWAPVLLALLLVCATPDDIQRALWYDRAAVEAGQLWRLLAASWCHLGWAHAMFNVVSLALLLTLFDKWRSRGALLLWLVIGLGVFVFEHVAGGSSYAVGMSGALYGFATFGALVWLRGVGAGLLLGGVALKLATDLWLGPWLSALWLEGPVLVSHHVAGAILGTLLGAAGRRAPRYWVSMETKQAVN